MVLLEEDLGIEVGELGIERSGWEMSFASLGLWMIFLSEDSLGEVGVEVVYCPLIALSRP